METFNRKMSQLDFELHSKLWVLLRQQGRATFTSDDFRMFGLDRFVSDTQHGIGGVFAKWRAARLIEPTGRMVRSSLPSNHGRKIQEFRMRGLEVQAVGGALHV